MIAIVVTVSVREEKAEEFETIARALEAKVKENEPDCLVYRMAKSRSEPFTYKNLEIFRDQAAFDRHVEADYFKLAAVSFAECVGSAPDIHFLDTLD